MRRITVIGDSTSGRELIQDDYRTVGWAQFANEYLDSSKYISYDKCVIGWGIRDFFNRRPDWLDLSMSNLEPGDVLLACFGTLERSPLSRKDFGARGSLFGDDKRSEIIYDEHYKVEYEVFTYGEYLRRLAAKAKEKGVELYFLSQVPRNTWENGKHKRTFSVEYAKIMNNVAKETGVGFIDINDILSKYLEGVGEEAAKEFYSPKDKSHTTEFGARTYCGIIIKELLKELEL